MRIHGTRRDGAVIIIVMIVLSLLAVITATVVKISSGTLQTTALAGDREAAFRAAESGARLGLKELIDDPNWTDFGGPVDMPGGEASYEVQVFTDSGPAPDNGVVVPTGMSYIQSTGRSKNGGTATAQRVTQIGLMIKQNGGVLDYAAAVNGSILVRNGGVVESRDPATDDVLPAAATVVTNSTASGSIQLDGGSTVVKGMARPGPGAPGSAVTLMNGAQATQGYSPLGAQVPMDPVVLPFAADPSKDVVVDGGANTRTIGGNPDSYNSMLQPGAYGSLTIQNGGELKLRPGEYVFNGITSLGGNIRLVGNAAVDFYSTDDVLFTNGALINDTKDPKRMKFHVTSGTVNLALTDVNAYYILNAPNSDVSLINGSRQYGNLISQNLVIDNSSLFFDPNAGGAVTSGGSTIPIVKSYQRFDK